MYSEIYLLLLIFGLVRLEELECNTAENLTVTEVSTTSLTVAWASSPLKSCVYTAVYLSEGTTVNCVEVRVLRSLNSVTFNDLDSCRDYYIDISPLAHDAQFSFSNTFITVRSKVNITRLAVIRSIYGTIVFKNEISLTSMIASDLYYNPECFTKMENIVPTDVTVAETADITETAGTITTSPLMLQSTNESDLENNVTTSTETTSYTTLEEANTETPKNDSLTICTPKALSWEVVSLEMALASKNSVTVTWLEPVCTLRTYLVILAHNDGRDVREVRVVRWRNSSHFLDLEECRAYSISVTPLTLESTLFVGRFDFNLSSRISSINAGNIITAAKSDETVSDFIVSNVTSSSADICWDPPRHRDCHATGVSRFHVIIERINNDSGGENSKYLLSPVSRVIFVGLESCAAYRVSVVVGVVGGYTSKANASIVVTTLPDKIRNLTAASVPPTSVLVTWAAPSHWDCVPERGKYLVTWESSPTPSVWLTDTNSFLLLGLERCTSHEYSVSMYTVGEVDPSIKSSILVNRDPSTNCNPAILLSKKLIVIITLPLCIILIAAVFVLRYRGLNIGGRRWEITDNWRFTRESIRGRYRKPKAKTTTSPETPV